MHLYYDLNRHVNNNQVFDATELQSSMQYIHRINTYVDKAFVEPVHL